MDSVLSAGIAGVQVGQSNALSAAQKIASAAITEPAAGGGVDPLAAVSANTETSGGLDAITEGAVELIASELQVKASAAVIKTADEILGTMIDTKI